MNNFTFTSPTRFSLCSGAELLAGEESKRFSDRVLVVHYGDAFIVKSGLLERITNALEQQGITWFQVDGIVPNPVLSPVYRGIELCKREGIGCILAIGGGSVIDTAKAIALGALYAGDVWDFYSKAVPAQKALPIGVVMTIPSTGSEGSNGSVITNEHTGEKLDVMDDCIRPAFTLMNPALVSSLPKKQMMLGIIDMFSHVTERYFSATQGDELTNGLCEATMKAIITCSRKVYTDIADEDVYANLMWASILAHNGLLGAGRDQDWATHMMGAPLSATYNAVHGATIAVLLPVWARTVYRDNLPLFARFAHQVFGIKPGGDTEAAALAGLKALEDWIQALGLPTCLCELGIKDTSQFETMAQAACMGGHIGAVRSLSAGDVVDIYTRALDRRR